MYLKHLIIANREEEIRNIVFHPGMNLIVDDTLADSEMTGNNVGKTTVLRLIDYCLGADARPIYTATDGSLNQKVKAFLEKTGVYVEACFVSTFVEDKGYKVVVRRNFMKRKNALNEINGKNYLAKDYGEALQMALWGVNTKTPEFAHIISHSIRLDRNRQELPLLTLGKKQAVLYETLFLFLFGLYEDFCAEKLELRKKITKEQQFKKRLEKDSSPLSELKTKLRRVEKMIGQLNEQKEALKVNPNFEDDLEKQVLIKQALTRLAMKQNCLELRRNLIEETVAEMQAMKAKAQTEEVRSIYEQANAFGTQMHHTFEELVAFHNAMLLEKVAFIRRELPDLDKQIGDCYRDIDAVRKEEMALDNKLRLSVSFETYEKISENLFEKGQEKAKLETDIDRLEKIQHVIQQKEEELKRIDDRLFTKEYTQKIDDRLDVFNDFFSGVSRKMYGKDFTIQQEKITSPDGKPCYKFSIADNGNYSDGVKKGEATCFDLAYVSFADKMKIPCLHFILNDKEELLHNNQLTLIAKIVEEQKNVQYISSILKSKLPEGINVNRYRVLSLAENNKLFRIPDEQDVKM